MCLHCKDDKPEQPRMPMWHSLNGPPTVPVQRVTRLGHTLYSRRCAYAARSNLQLYSDSISLCVIRDPRSITDGIDGAPTTIAHMADYHCAVELQHVQYWHSLYIFSHQLAYHIGSGFTGGQQVLTHGVIASARAVESATCGLADLLSAPIRHAVGFIAANPVLAALFLFLGIAWQVYYPLTVTLRLVLRLRCFSGCLFEILPQQNVQTQDKYIALTLNSGPSPYSTDAILAVLAQYDAHATMFVTGADVEKCDAIGAGSGVEGLGKAVLAKLLAEGHQLGISGW